MMLSAMRIHLLTLTLFVTTGICALAQEAVPPHPAISQDSSWVPVMLIVIGGMFLAAAVIGPIVRANMPEEIPPPAHSHDEPPGASHHHGPGGTANPAPEDELPDSHGQGAHH